VRCRNVYPDLGMLYRLTYSKWKRMAGHGTSITKFFGGTRLRVRGAPEPAEIIWENLGVGPFSRAIRLACTSIITIGFLAGAFVLIYKGQEAQVQAAFQYVRSRERSPAQRE
jgi:hypothetical protein